MGIDLSVHDHDCLANLSVADDVQLQKMLYELTGSTEKVGPRIHSGKTEVLSNLSSPSPHSMKEMQVDDVEIEILTRSESVRYSGQLINKGRQTVFFTPLDPFGDDAEEEDDDLIHKAKKVHYKNN